MPNEDRLKALLSDLGKSTLRGVRKCSKCGTLNGIRSVMCKNKACDQVFKDAGIKRKNTTEVCKLITGTSTKVFSVRLRDKGPDYRGFVQLPFLYNAMCPRPTDLIINEPSAVCFVENCQRIFNTNILKCHERDTSPFATCKHIQAATRCFTTAQPLNIDSTAMFMLNIPNHIRDEFWQLSAESAGPLVQRVSKTIMAVRCKVTSKHPLGYLHVSFTPTKLHNHFQCSCPAYKAQGTKNRPDDAPPDRKCLHYYTCIAAFASDDKLSEEFASFIEQERSKSVVINIQERSPVPGQENNCTQRVVATLGGLGSNMQVEVEVMGEEERALLEPYILSGNLCPGEEFGNISESVEPDVCHQASNPALGMSAPDLLTTIKTSLQIMPVSEPSQLKRKKDVDISEVILNNGVKKSRKIKSTHMEHCRNQVPDEKVTHQTFIRWLATVTERINQQMHYQFSGKPTPLVFHTPQEFFDCLRERISQGRTKKRLPNMTTVFVRKHAIPLGTFTKYTWHINNILHCKQIFETPLMPLELMRSFMVNSDGTYDEYKASNLKDEAFSKLNNSPKIKPLEFKTFLKVGNTAPDQTVPTPMIIEWIPDIFPKTKVGELKITFEFGHRRP